MKYVTTNTVGSVWPTTDLSAKQETSTMPRVASTIPKIFDQHEMSSHLPAIA